MKSKITGQRFLAVTLLNVLITVVEIIGGPAVRQFGPPLRCFSQHG